MKTIYSLLLKKAKDQMAFNIKNYFIFLYAISESLPAITSQFSSTFYCLNTAK